jgi:predicted TIM-barrel enzyme
MNRIEEVFGTAPVLLPVVHPVGRREALEAVRVANSLGLRGVFLIDQIMHERDVLALVREVHDLYPDLWVGVNLLRRSPAGALMAVLGDRGVVDGLWSDNAEIDEYGTGHSAAEEFVTTRRRGHWGGLYFGGVAFKYQRPVALADLGRAASYARAYMDVVCTSGAGTGVAADVEKVRSLRSGLGEHALALASGVTVQNVGDYLPYVQAFLVGTGIEASLGVLDPKKIECLLRAMEGGRIRTPQGIPESSTG